MLRREFSPWREWRREVGSSTRRVLVTFGGSDPGNVTSRVIRDLVGSDLDVVVTIGGSNPYSQSLEQSASQFRGKIRLLADPANMPELMAWADVAISSAGSISSELCLLGLPTILIDVAPNQTPVAHALNRLGAAIHLGSPEILGSGQLTDTLQSLLTSRDTRVAISQCARKLVDGRGVQRVISAMTRSGLWLRSVEEEDCRLLWEWANDPDVRAASFFQDKISWEQHVDWFHAKIRDACTRIYLASDSRGLPLGIVRYRLDDSRATVSISLDKESRGKGYGKMILDMANEKLFCSTNIVAVDAYVKQDNQPSLKIFEKAGFEYLANEIMHGQESVHLVLRRHAR